MAGFAFFGAGFPPAATRKETLKVHRSILRPLIILTVFLATGAVGASRLPGDLNRDHRIDSEDLWMLAYHWLDQNCLTPGCATDLDGMGQVNAKDFALLADDWHADGTTLVISEFMASNHSEPPLQTGEVLDEDGDASDWIEIYNPTDRPISLDGWYLTDSNDELDLWRFPDGLTLGPDQYMVVFASAKDRKGPRQELHTNFALAVEGEYLALVENTGHIAHEYAPKYPPQEKNTTYGLASDTRLVPTDASAAYLVPGRADAESDWRSLDFDDAAWRTGPANMSFGDTSPGLDVMFIQAKASVPDLATAETVVANRALQERTATARMPAVNYRNTGPGGNYPNDLPFPGTTIDSNVDNFAVLITGVVMIPESGHWTFGARGDQGYAMTLTRGDTQLSLSCPSPSPRGVTDTLETFYIPQAGFYAFRLLFYEYVGYSGLEVFAGKGTFSTFSQQYFRLLGDTENGGLRCSARPNTDVQPLMLDTNTTLWTRIEFDAFRPDMMRALKLSVNYEDGFAAYINGRHAATANMPNSPMWNSAAATDRPDEMAAESVEFDVSHCIEHLVHGRNVLAVQTCNDDVSDTAFEIACRLDAANRQLAQQYFAKPSPWQPNETGMVDIVSEPKFSHQRGFYDSDILVTIATETPGAKIYFTLDGSDPYDTDGRFQPGIPYAGPLRIAQTSCLRAIAVKPGWKPSNIVTHTYVMNADSKLRSLPIVSLVGDHGETFYEPHGVMAIVGGRYEGGKWVSDGPGSYNNVMQRGMEYERPVSFEYVKPDNRDDLQIDCGLRVHGSN